MYTQKHVIREKTSSSIPLQGAKRMNSGGYHSKLSSRLLSATAGTAAQLPSGQKGLSLGRPLLQLPLAGLRAGGGGQGRPQERTGPAQDETAPAPGLGERGREAKRSPGKGKAGPRTSPAPAAPAAAPYVPPSSARSQTRTPSPVPAGNQPPRSRRTARPGDCRKFRSGQRRLLPAVLRGVPAGPGPSEVPAPSLR